MMRDLLGAAAAALCYAGYICSVAVFCGRHLRALRFCEPIFGLLLFLGGVFWDYAGRSGAASYMVMMLSYHILFVGAIFLFFREKAEKKVFTAAVLIAVTTLVENFCVSLLSCLELFYLHVVKRIEASCIVGEESWRIVGGGLIFTAFSVSALSGYFPAILYGKSKRWYLILSVPLFAAALMVDVANWGAAGGIMVRSGGSMDLYRDQLFSYAGNCVLTALSAFGAGSCVFGMNRLYREQEKSAQYRVQVAAYRMLEDQYRHAERLRHDLKNHLLTLSGFLESREWDKMAGYLNDMRNIADFGGGEEITGNRTVDLLLYQKRKAAESGNITWECDAQMPPQCRIREFDLCVLLGNLLDNAVEACGRLCQEGDDTPFIRIRIGKVKNCLLLEIENSMMADRREADAAFGQKSGKEFHGIGLSNVRDVVRRYDGTMHIEKSGGVFAVSVLIHFPDAGSAAHDTGQTV